MRIEVAEKMTGMATKIHAAALAALTEEEKQYPLLDEVIWLAMQMLCRPSDAACVVSRCQIRQ